MLKVRTSKETGFTIVELLVVIVVIAILATISAVVYSGAQARARDSIRKNDLAEIKKALFLYNVDKGTWMDMGSGCGYEGDGNGWVNYTDGGPDYSKSIMNCLVEAGYVSRDFKDPTGGVQSTSSQGYAYMRYWCDWAETVRVYLYAKLETLPQSSTATDGTCNDNLDTNYGMNYYIQVK